MLMAGHRTGLRGERAARVLELNGSVVDIEAVVQDAIDVAQNGLALRRRHVLDQHVTAQGMRLRAQAPDVQIVHVTDPRRLPDGAGYFRELQSLGQPFQQNVERILEYV